MPESVKTETCGFRCTDCKKAMFFLRYLPNLGQRVSFADMFCVAGARAPGPWGYTCQFCGAHWVRLNLDLRFVKKFEKETGKEIE